MPGTRSYSLATALILISLLLVTVTPVGAARQTQAAASGPDGLGLVDVGTAEWHLRTADGDPTVFTFGSVGHAPLMGDWDGDGIDTPGMYRESDGFVLLRNSNTAGDPDHSYSLDAVGDTIPIAGDWDGDGNDTVSYYRPSSSEFAIINDLTGTVDSTFSFGAANGRPFSGDFDGDGTDTVGVHNGTTLSFRNSLSEGPATIEFSYGAPGDVVLTGDWNGDGDDTFAVYRPGTLEVHLHNSNAAGNPDQTYTWGDPAWLPVAGHFGPLNSGIAITWDASSDAPPAGLESSVESLYLEFANAPSLPAGLRTNLADIATDPQTMVLSDLVYSGAAAFGGFVSVVTAGADTILLASDDGVAWRVAGAHMARYGRDRWFGESPRFVAVIGGDTDTNPDPLLSAADSLHIISLVPEDGAGTIVGIPRDTVMKVSYPRGWTAAQLQELANEGLLTQARADAINAHCGGQCDKINRTMMDKGDGLPSGPATTVTALELETGLDLEGYFHTGFGSPYTDFPGFRDLVNAFISTSGSEFSFTAPYGVDWAGVLEGQTTLDGTEALAFARERKTLPLGDYDRTLAHGLLFKAAIANVQLLNLQSTPGLLAVMDDFVNTDLTVDQILTFAATLFVVDAGPMPTLRGFHLDMLGSLAYDRNEGTIPNVLISGCSDPVFFDDGTWSTWYTDENWATFADLADGTLTSTPWRCETIPGTDAASVWSSLPLGLLRVETTPEIDTRILIDGKPTAARSLDWLKIPPGTYQVSFLDVEGFTTPAAQTVTVSEDSTTTVTGSYSQQGWLQVTTSPPVPAQIRVDGIPRNDWGLRTPLPPNDYLVCFGDVSGFTAPPCRTATVTAGEVAEVTGNYSPNPEAPAPNGHGLLRVTTSPPVPAQIWVDGIPRDSWGLNWLKVPPGTYQISFTDVRGFTTPPDQTVTVTAGETTEVTGTFTQQGLLRVTTSPPLPSTIFVDGDPSNDWGLWTDVSPGDHVVCFSDIAGFVTPPCETVTVIAGGLTEIIGSFQ